MKKALHLVIRKDELAQTVIEEQKKVAQVEEIQLEGADYQVVVEKIFTADSVAVWS